MPSAFSGTLHPYQVDDVQVMKDLGRTLVAYGQGTGKTVMTIACLEELMAEDEITEPGLVVALSSLKYQWADRICQFTGGTYNHKKRKWEGHASTPLVIDGTPKQRAEQYRQAMDWQADYVIVGYETVVNDWAKVRQLPRGFVVADEVTFIKGFRAQRARRVKRLQHGVEFVYGLTGTPVENGKPEEMYSIMQFVDDEVLGRWDIFDKAFIVRNGYGGVQRYRNIPVFHKTMKKAMVRRTRDDADVAPYMPKVHKPTPLMVKLDKAAAKLYRLVATELLDDLAEASEMMGSGFSLDNLYGHGGDDEANALRGRIGQKLLTLQWVCDHPELLRRSAQRYEDVFAGKAASGGSGYVAQLAADGKLDGLKATPKLDLFERHLKELLELDPANKIVTFTVYVDMVELIASRFGDKFGAETYSGRMNAKQKDAALKRFQADPKARIFISSDAGGYGVDIPQANYLFNYDLPDKWGTSDQRNTRIDRASSEFTDIYVRDILVEGSTEERKHLALAQKGAVANAFVDGKGINKKGGVDLTLGNLSEWLRENEV